LIVVLIIDKMKYLRVPIRGMVVRFCEFEIASLRSQCRGS
jgi:hypothetical protein